LESFGIDVVVHDPVADHAEAGEEFALRLAGLEELVDLDAVVLAVAHGAYLDGGWDLIEPMLRNGRGLVMDVKSRLDRGSAPPGIELWRL
jgi:UDP-N-acetyl-D-galactosamine dehydrogenase